MKFCQSVFMTAIAFAVILSGGCNKKAVDQGACKGVTCSGHGTCTDIKGSAVCKCEQGYYSAGSQCKNNCDGVTCSGQGSCVISNAVPSCQCTDPYVPAELECIRNSCTGINCSDHGKCELTSGRAGCTCDNGYVASGLECKPKETIRKLGEICADGTQCESGMCLKYAGQTTGYCSKLSCTGPADCRNYAGDGAALCCVDLGGGTTACLKTRPGSTCGTQTGKCGDSCAGQLDSACTPGYPCLMMGMDDPNATCGVGCTKISDCSQCRDPNDASVEFDCQSAGSESYCLAVRGECESSQDCSTSEVCVATVASDYSRMYGICTNGGDQPIGATCDDKVDPSTLDQSERCIGFYCLFGHCSEVCTLENDCTNQNMVCGIVNFRLDDAGHTGSIGMCQYIDGTGSVCSGDGSCPNGEACTFYLPPSGSVKKVCTKELCDPANTAACAGPGDDCSTLPCYNGLCLTDGVNAWCAPMCDGHLDCSPYGMICGGLRVSDTDITGACVDFDGSARACDGDPDCAADGTNPKEACTYVASPTSVEMICMTPVANGAGVGEPCDATTPCYNNMCMTDSSGQNFCGAACKTSGDCPDGFMCSGFQFSGDDNVYGTCSAAPGSADPCMDDTDCVGKTPAEACNYIMTPAGVESICLEEEVAGKDLGETCDAANPCYNGLCLQNSGTGETWCGAACNEHAACRALKPAETGWFCGSLAIDDTTTVGTCSKTADGSTVAACESDLNCATTSEVCTFLPPPRAEAGSSVAVCVKPAAGGAINADCSEQAPCANGICLTDGYCSAVCATNDDCPKAPAGKEMLCRYIGLNEAGTLFGTACVRADANAPICSLCLIDADCTPYLAGATCRTSLTTQENYCTKPCAVQNDCFAGWSCTANECVPPGDTCIPSHP